VSCKATAAACQSAALCEAMSCSDLRAIEGCSGRPVAQSLRRVLVATTTTWCKSQSQVGTRHAPLHTRVSAPAPQALITQANGHGPARRFGPFRPRCGECSLRAVVEAVVVEGLHRRLVQPPLYDLLGCPSPIARRRGACLGRGQRWLLGCGPLPSLG
jgi:hypothetical protein